MKLNWNDNHAEAGPFKLNVRRSNADGTFVVESSTPGYCGWTLWDLPTEEQAKAAAERWIEEQLVKFLVDVGINPNTALDGTVKCEACYGTGRWGPNGAEEHGPCKGTGRLPKEANKAACAICGHPESAPAHQLPPTQKGPPWYAAWDHPFQAKV